jgi:molybdate transport system ATP-binding protein
VAFTAAATRMRLELQNIDLPLGTFDLQVDAVLEGDITAVFGPSGAGKTSLLELVAGLRRPRTARIVLDGAVLQDSNAAVALPARERGIGYVPQDLALFPHLSVRDNVLFGSPAHANGGTFGLRHVVEVLEIVPLLERGVPRLSGGERQRVAIARALLARPRLLLLDEPMEALDSKLRARVMELLRRLFTEFAIPMLYVSHSRREILTLCDDMLVLEHGRVVQRGSPVSVWGAPSGLTADLGDD